MSKLSSPSVLVPAVLAVAGLLSPTLALADWTGKGEAGVVLANGNTEARNANAKLELATTLEQWKHSVGVAAIYASTDDLTTGQRWELYGQSDYNFSERDFWFGAARYEDDRFSGFEYQATLSSGVGHRFIDQDRTKFTGTAGVGYKFFETRDAVDDATGALLSEGDTDSQAVFRGTLDFSHDITDTTQVLDQFLVESGSENTFVQNDIGVKVKMTEVLALAAAYSVRYNSHPPAGFRKTDTLTTLNLVYEIR